MFSRKYPVLFVSKHFVESGTLTRSREPFFEAGETISYEGQSLVAVLEGMKALKGKTCSLVLSEELVYVTALAFPHDTKLTRELIQKRAEELIPESLSGTQWDFRTMRYVTKKATPDTVWVQVAVVEQLFADSLEKVLSSSVFSIATILPESYALASLLAQEEGLTVIGEQNREHVLLVACDQGVVLATEVQKSAPTLEAIQAFIHFLEEQKSQKPERIIFSHDQNEDREQALQQEGYAVFNAAYNPLFSVLLEPTSGTDESVLNLNVSRTPISQSWFQRWRKKAS